MRKCFSDVLIGVSLFSIGVLSHAGSLLCNDSNKQMSPQSCSSKQNGILNIKRLKKRQPDTPTPRTKWNDRNFSFEVIYPKSMTPSRTFEEIDGVGQSWSYFDEMHQGNAAVAFVLSNDQSIQKHAQIRIGVSENPQQLSACLELPSKADDQKLKTMRLNKQNYTYFKASNMQNSPYVAVDAYRIVHANRCYSVELIVADTSTSGDKTIVSTENMMSRLTGIWQQMKLRFLSHK